MPDRRASLRMLPAIDRLIDSPLLSSLAMQHPHVLIRDAAQQTVDRLRRPFVSAWYWWKWRHIRRENIEKH